MVVLRCFAAGGGLYYRASTSFLPSMFLSSLALVGRVASPCKIIRLPLSFLPVASLYRCPLLTFISPTPLFSTVSFIFLSLLHLGFIWILQIFAVVVEAGGYMDIAIVKVFFSVPTASFLSP